MADTVFASEEAKIAALDNIEETPANVDEIKRIMDAPVTPTEPQKVVEPPTEKPAETPPPATPPKEEIKPAEPAPGQKPDAITIPLSELPEEYRNFDDAAKLLKKVKNQDELIERQTLKIREILQNAGVNTPDQIETLRRENEELRRSIQAAPKPDAGAAEAQRLAAKSQSKINEIITRRRALLAKHSDLEDQQFNPEFIKERNALDDMMVEELARQNQYLETVSSGVEETKKLASDAISMRRTDDAKAKEAEVFNNEVKAIQSFADSTEGFKLSKPFMELDKEYRDYQNQIASIYWGRPPASPQEIKEAMDKLQQRSPKLIGDLQAAGIPQEPTDDMQKYLATCEIWDAWQGIRKDPVTGDYRRDAQGNIVPLTRWDPLTKQYVRDSYPSPQAAYNDLQVNSGHYTRKIVEAFKKGGMSLAEARSKRDGGVVEMDNASGGKPKISADTALEDIQKVDEEEAVLRARGGDPSLLKRYNDNALILGWPALTV